MMIEITGRFVYNTDDCGRSCPARWRHRCLNLPTQWVVFWCEDDQNPDQFNTVLTRYCQQCWAVVPATKSRRLALTDEQAAQLLLDAEVYKVQSQ